MPLTNLSTDQRERNQHWEITSLEVELIKNSIIVTEFNLILLMRVWNHSQLQQFVINPWRDSMMGVELICATPKSICAHSTVPVINNAKNTQIEQTK